MKKSLSLIVIAFFLYNCQDSSIVDPIIEEPVDQDYSIQKIPSPNSNEVRRVVKGNAKFDPENGFGGYLDNKSVFYPSTLTIGNRHESVAIIRNEIQAPNTAKAYPVRNITGIFKIVESNGNSTPTGMETILFRGKFSAVYNKNILTEVKYWGKGVNTFSGATLTASESILFDDHLKIKYQKLRKVNSSPAFSSLISGKLVRKLYNVE
jgi:hypothetical protein